MPLKSTTMLMVALLASSAAAWAHAQELTTDAERLYRDARRSDDRMTQLLAERWNSLVELQTWTDTSGQFDVTAKYVEHDPEMKWVKLRAVKESDGQRVVKDLTVPLAKLDKKGQARVRQIAIVRPKLEEAMAAAAQAAEEANDRPLGRAEGEEQIGLSDERSPRGPAELHEGRGERGGRPVIAPPRGGLEAPPPGPAPPAEPPPPPGAGTSVMMSPFPAFTAAPPDSPPTFPDDASRNIGQDTAQPVNALASGDLSSQSPKLLSSEAWTSDYEQFRAQFMINRDGTVLIQAEAGPLAVLRDQYSEHQLRMIRRDARSAPPDEAALAERLLDEVGEFVWEVELAGDVGDQNDWTTLLNLSPLPEPATLTLKLDETLDKGHWRGFQKGSRVRFIGHFTGFEGLHGLVAEIRFPENQPTEEE